MFLLLMKMMINVVAFTVSGTTLRDLHVLGHLIAYILILPHIAGLFFPHMPIVLLPLVLHASRICCFITVFAKCLGKAGDGDTVSATRLCLLYLYSWTIYHLPGFVQGPLIFLVLPILLSVLPLFFFFFSPFPSSPFPPSYSFWSL